MFLNLAIARGVKPALLRIVTAQVKTLPVATSAGKSPLSKSVQCLQSLP
jgi:hypothetical protein